MQPDAPANTTEFEIASINAQGFYKRQLEDALRGGINKLLGLHLPLSRLAAQTISQKIRGFNPFHQRFLISDDKWMDNLEKQFEGSLPALVAFQEMQPSLEETFLDRHKTYKAVPTDRLGTEYGLAPDILQPPEMQPVLYDSDVFTHIKTEKYFRHHQNHLQYQCLGYSVNEFQHKSGEIYHVANIHLPAGLQFDKRRDILEKLMANIEGLSNIIIVGDTNMFLQTEIDDRDKSILGKNTNHVDKPTWLEGKYEGPFHLPQMLLKSVVQRLGLKMCFNLDICATSDELDAKVDLLDGDTDHKIVRAKIMKKNNPS